MLPRLVSLSFFVFLVAADSHYGRTTFGEGLVIGGRNADRAEFPYQVSLQWGDLPYTPFRHTCGGSIIDERWILSAAHCVVNLPEHGQFVVKAGKIFLDAWEVAEQIAQVENITVHQYYRNDAAPYDIALLKLSSPLTFNAYVAPVDLPTPRDIPEGTATLTGWGSTSKTAQPRMPSFLQKVQLPLLDIETCREAFAKLGVPWEVHDTNVCTGPLTGHYSACNGDSGGPLVKTENERTELIGIVSWGNVPCGAVGAPAVFVRVSAFIDWIYTMKAYHS